MNGASLAEGCALSAFALHPERQRKNATAQVAQQKTLLGTEFI